MSKCSSIGGMAMVILSVGAAMTQPAAAGQRGGPIRYGSQSSPEIRLPDPAHNVLLASEPFEVGQYWLGIECLPLMPALRAQLNLPEKQGLLVAAIVPDSPAAGAGIKRHDVLMRVGEKPLAEVRDLIQAIDAAKGAKLKIELIRGGKPKTLEAVPVKRPEAAGQKAPPPPEAGDWSTIQKWMEGMLEHEEGQAERPPMRFWFARPGAIVPKDVLVPRPLPPDMSIVISKEGDAPAKITVKRGDKKWEVTEKQLDKLPADVRPFVEQMLGHGPFGIVGNVQAFELPVPPEGGKFQIRVPPPGMMQIQPFPAPGSLDERIQKRFDEMDRRIEKLFRAIEDLQTGHGQQPAPKSDEGK
jgi:membrane-associated protease RseP (regulator of RpoE activity)